MSAAASRNDSGKALAMMLRLAGLTHVVAKGRAALQLMNSLVDTLAVYVLMAMLTCDVELELQGKAWFLRGQDEFPS